MVGPCCCAKRHDVEIGEKNKEEREGGLKGKREGSGEGTKEESPDIQRDSREENRRALASAHDLSASATGRGSEDEEKVEKEVGERCLSEEKGGGFLLGGE